MDAQKATEGTESHENELRQGKPQETQGRPQKRITEGTAKTRRNQEKTAKIKSYKLLPIVNSCK